MWFERKMSLRYKYGRTEISKDRPRNIQTLYFPTANKPFSKQTSRSIFVNTRDKIIGIVYSVMVHPLTGNLVLNALKITLPRPFQFQ